MKRISRVGDSGAQQLFDKKLELKALSRESRDLISLVLKCFSAQNYFINSKIVNAVEDHEFSASIVKHSKFPSRSGLLSGFNNPPTSTPYVMSDVLLELEFVKHDLNSTLTLLQDQEQETLRYKQ